MVIYEVVQGFSSCPEASVSSCLPPRVVEVIVNSELGTVPPKFAEIPNDITQAQAVALWKHAVLFQDRQRQE